MAYVEITLGQATLLAATRRDQLRRDQPLERVACRHGAVPGHRGVRASAARLTTVIRAWRRACRCTVPGVPSRRKPGGASRAGVPWSTLRGMRLAALAVLAVALGTPASSIAKPPQPARPQNTWLTTDRDQYVPAGLPSTIQFQIELRYTNRSKTPRYFPGCGEPAPPILEKLMSGVWSVVYRPVVPLCKGPTVVVAPGATYAFGYRVMGSLDGRFKPAFDADAVPGVYRARWRAYRKQLATPAGDTEEEDPEDVFSNSFTIINGAR